MGTVLAGSSTRVGGFEIPQRGAFQLCFVIGAAAAFLGVTITALIPRPTTADISEEWAVPVVAQRG